MSQDTTTPQPGLPPRIAKLLLDKLETDQAFRDAFTQSPAQALRSLGHTVAAPCLALKPGATLASPAEIRAQRVKLEAAMTAVQKADCLLCSQSGH